EWRPVQNAKIVGHRLLLKAATRLRRLGYYAQDMDLSLRVEQGPRLKASCRFYRACDNVVLTHNFLKMWHDLVTEFKPHRILKVSIVLHNLIPADKIRPELFDNHPEMPHQQMKRYESMSLAM